MAIIISIMSDWFLFCFNQPTVDIFTSVRIQHHTQYDELPNKIMNQKM
jgi:hypothetical protein